MSTLNSSQLINKMKFSWLPKDAAGNKMTTKIPVVSSRHTLGDVRNLLFDRRHQWESLSYIYVTSNTGTLVGVFSIKTVFNNEESTLVREIMESKVVAAKATLDQERVAHLALKHNLKMIPLVDAEHKLVGVVPSREILSILNQEQNEDILRISGIMPGHHGALVSAVDVPFWKSLKQRAPWIVVGLFGGLLTAKVINGFEHTLQQELALAAFIPLVVYLSNAVGSQSQTLYIRDLAIHPNIKIVPYAFKQLGETTILGLMCWLIVYLLTLLIWGTGYLGMIIGFSVFLAIFLATIFAMTIPTGLQRLKLDPAVGSGPFATIIMDLVSVVIYFGVATLLL
jgi:magnesium transporter